MQRRQAAPFGGFVPQVVDAALCRHRHLVENGFPQAKPPQINNALRSLAP
jgi:hypothetical protein